MIRNRYNTQSFSSLDFYINFNMTRLGKIANESYNSLQFFYQNREFYNKEIDSIPDSEFFNKYQDSLTFKTAGGDTK